MNENCRRIIEITGNMFKFRKPKYVNKRDGKVLWIYVARFRGDWLIFIFVSYSENHRKHICVVYRKKFSTNEFSAIKINLFCSIQFFFFFKYIFALRWKEYF